MLTCERTQQKDEVREESLIVSMCVGQFALWEFILQEQIMSHVREPTETWRKQERFLIVF